MFWGKTTTTKKTALVFLFKFPGLKKPSMHYIAVLFMELALAT